MNRLEAFVLGVIVAYAVPVFAFWIFYMLMLRSEKRDMREAKAIEEEKE